MIEFYKILIWIRSGESEKDFNINNDNWSDIISVE